MAPVAISRKNRLDLINAYIKNSGSRSSPQTQLAKSWLVAIGRPSEELPALGAARIYVARDRWQQAVADIASVSQLVIWTTGTSEGLRWEISHLLSSLPLQKLIVWAHPHLLRLEAPEREAEWSRFLTLFDDVFQHALPRTLGRTRFLHFDAQGRVMAVRPRRSFLGWLLGAQDVSLTAILMKKAASLPGGGP